MIFTLSGEFAGVISQTKSILTFTAVYHIRVNLTRRSVTKTLMYTMHRREKFACN